MDIGLDAAGLCDTDPMADVVVGGGAFPPHPRQRHNGRDNHSDTEATGGDSHQHTFLDALARAGQPTRVHCLDKSLPIA